MTIAKSISLLAGLLSLLPGLGNCQSMDNTSPPAALNASTNYLPKWSPDGSRIIFSSTADGNWEIYTVKSDGSDATRLTVNEAYDSGASWSPDGARVLYFSEQHGNREIYTMATNGSDQIRLTNDAAEDINPAYSPDGARIVFVSDRQGQKDIYVMNADGTGIRPLTRDYRVNSYTRPAFSPDGKEIAFYTSRTGNNEDVRSLYIMDSRGIDIKPVKGGDFDANQAWSPDGGRLAFDAPWTGKNASANGEWEIYLARKDGSERRRLTHNTRNDWGPAYSPDGKRIAFCSGWNNQYEIFVMNSDGSAMRRVTRRVYP